jgi:lactate 2-monooxygenase
MSQYGDYQNEIYEAGIVRGSLPRWPMDYQTLERNGSAALPDWILSFVAEGAGAGRTQRANVEAFDGWGIVPRMMQQATKRDLSVSLFGLDLPSPLFLAPIGVSGICSQDFHGDLALAGASARTGVPWAVTTLAQDPLEQVAARLGGTPGFFQLYTPSDRDVATSLIQRAERAGYRALIVTLDSWISGWRPGDLNLANTPELRGYVLANYFSDPYFRKRLATSPEDDPRAAVQEWVKIFGLSVGWDDLAWMRDVTSLPIVLKGINHPDDARRAKDHGVDGIYCSNHGGRQADGGLPALDALPEVVDAAGDTPVLFDSGIRTGADAVKALALGATAVGIGRPYIYALALGGEDAVVHIVRSLLAEADLLMAVDGYPTLADLRAYGAIRRVPGCQVRLLVHLLGHGPESFRGFGVERVGGDPGGVGAGSGRVVRDVFLAVLEVPADHAIEPGRGSHVDAGRRALGERLEGVPPGRAERLEFRRVVVAGKVGVGDGPRVQGVDLDPVTAPVPGSGHGEQHVRGLGLSVGQCRVIRAVAEVDVVEDDRGVQMGPGADRDNPGAAGGPQRGQQP